MSAPPRIVIIGVSASGKSTVADGLAQQLDVPFRDADDLHPAANIRKMSAGIALTDEDRSPWLEAVGRVLAAEPSGIVVACSALRRAYRDQLRRHAPDVCFVHLTGSRELLTARASARGGHFMPASLLDSQLSILEPLADDEPGVTIDVTPAPDAVIRAAVAALSP
ncbi:gluconate kinase [Parafrankia soli]|uniref:Gluconokinase n=1 Tax=Parafrankia soli TaxID=2599596 RepID=A0A1S1PJR6_9ACTN|nr:gluconokinase [Parafrankia soli]OHV21339.1 gluconate kinase [Parafrankia soli]